MLAKFSAKTSVALTPNWKITLLGVFLLPVLIKLGFWQLERAAEKQKLLDLVQIQGQKPPLSLDHSNWTPANLLNRRVKIEGSFLPGVYWLLDNRVFQGKVGYQVIAPLQTTTGKTVLVNRGWFPAPALRSQLPHVEFPEQSVVITGRWKDVSKHHLVRDLSGSDSNRWPVRVQKVDHHLFEMQLGKSLQVGVIQVAAEDPLALSVDWKYVNALPAKHKGYAVQWFTMSVVLIIALIMANTNLATALSERRRGKKAQSSTQ